MLTDTFVTELTSSLPYLGIILVLIPTLGFLVMDKVMTRRINLKDALFTKDNPVAGFEFGMVMMLLFFLGYNAVEGPAHADPMTDYLVAIGAMVITIILLSVMRAILGKVVSGHNRGHDLNHEIYEQKNWAAACMSVALMLGIVNGVTEENILGPNPIKDLAIAGTVMVLGLSVVFIFRLLYLRGKSFMNIMFTQDNPAAGVSLLIFAIAANMITHEAAFVVKKAALPLGESVVSLVLGASVLIVTLSVMRFVVEFAISKIFKLSINKEIFEDQNVGASFVDAGVVLGCAIILTGVLI